MSHTVWLHTKYCRIPPHGVTGYEMLRTMCHHVFDHTPVSPSGTPWTIWLDLTNSKRVPIRNQNFAPVKKTFWHDARNDGLVIYCRGVKVSTNCTECDMVLKKMSIWCQNWSWIWKCFGDSIHCF
jgi:hypothetical protein